MPKQFYLKIDVFKVAEMSHKIFGLLLYENLSPRTIKNRPIWSHWFVANMCQGQKYLYDVISVNRCLLNDLFINNVIWIMKFFFLSLYIILFPSIFLLFLSTLILFFSLFILFSLPLFTFSFSQINPFFSLSQSLSHFLFKLFFSLFIFFCLSPSLYRYLYISISIILISNQK